MADDTLAPCLQQRWRTLWGLNQALPADCPEAIGPSGGGLVNLSTCLGEKYASGRLALVSSNEDATIAQFFGFGENDCAKIDGYAAALSGATFAAGLTDLRTTYLSQSPAWATYFVTSKSHTYLHGDGSFYDTTVGGVPLTTWTGNLVNGGPIDDIW